MDHTIYAVTLSAWDYAHERQLLCLDYRTAFLVWARVNDRRRRCMVGIECHTRPASGGWTREQLVIAS